MYILDLLFKKKSAPQVVQRAASKNTPQPKAASPAKPGAGAPSPGVPAQNIIDRREDVPAFSLVLSADGQPLAISSELQESYVILLVSKERRDVYVVTSSNIRNSGIDDNFQEILGRIKKNNYNRLKRLVATPEIIAILNDESKKQQSYEDQQRAATKIQLDFDSLLSVATEQGISDIHIEVRKDKAEVKFRQHGELHVHKEWPVDYAVMMATVVYQVIADVKDTMFDPDRPQDAVIDRELSETGRVRVRLATLTDQDGFDFILRVLRMGVDDDRKSLEELGYAPQQMKIIRRGVAKPSGAIIMAGTTGSGKSTSLKSMIEEKVDANHGTIKVITVEDPPEYKLRATQVAVNRARAVAKQGGDTSLNPFALYMRAIMRSDPDVIMPGEVRDKDSAEMLVGMVESGHQVFTTVHAASGIGIVNRLRSNGVPNDVLGSPGFLAVLIYQALIPVVCQACCVDFNHVKASAVTDTDEDFIHRMEKFVPHSVLHTLKFRNYDGCPECRKGVVGRTVAAEAILPDNFMLKCFRERREADAFMHYRAKGGRFAIDHGIDKAYKGLVDMRDVEKRLDEITLLSELSDGVRVHFGLQPARKFEIGLDVMSDAPFDVDVETRKESESTIGYTPKEQAQNAEALSKMVALADDMDTFFDAPGDSAGASTGAFEFKSDLLADANPAPSAEVVHLGDFRGTDENGKGE